MKQTEMKTAKMQFFAKKTLKNFDAHRFFAEFFRFCRF